jgi:hypothetical protein
MRRSTWPRWPVLGNALLALTGAACTGAGHEQPTPTPSATSQLALVTGVTAPDGGTLRVTEQGLSQIKDGAGKLILSFGVLLQNTSTNWVATGTKLTVTLANDAGPPVEDRVEHGQYSVYGRSLNSELARDLGRLV